MCHASEPEFGLQAGTKRADLGVIVMPVDKRRQEVKLQSGCPLQGMVAEKNHCSNLTIFCYNVHTVDI